MAKRTTTTYKTALSGTRADSVRLSPGLIRVPKPRQTKAASTNDTSKISQVNNWFSTSPRFCLLHRYRKNLWEQQENGLQPISVEVRCSRLSCSSLRKVYAMDAMQNRSLLSPLINDGLSPHSWLQANLSVFPTERLSLALRHINFPLFLLKRGTFHISAMPKRCWHPAGTFPLQTRPALALLPPWSTQTLCTSPAVPLGDIQAPHRSDRWNRCCSPGKQSSLASSSSILLSVIFSNRGFG